MMQIDWWTFALQAVNFLILVWLLQRFLYRPVREVIEKRKALAEQAFAEAAKQKGEAEAAQQRFEASRTELARERQDLLNKMHEELAAERERIIEQARREAGQLIEAARASIAEEREAALAGVREQVADLAVELASALLTKIGSAALNDVFLERIEQQLRALPTEESDRLRKDLAADGARLTVVTAVPLTEDERERWRTQLGAFFGQNEETDFETAPDLIGGVELHFPHAVIRFTLADQLAKAKGILLGNETVS